MVWGDYTWIVVCGALAAFFTAYGIGANDVANAFGSSVAARTLTMRQALLIATVCEFSGSVLLGGQVTRTVAGGIARLSVFDQEPEVYMFGMLCALAASGTWLLVATMLGLPVSTTHSIVGAVMGFAFVYGGPGGVVWLESQKSFPYMQGMVPIIVSWFTSPLLSGLTSAFLFLVVRSAILRRENSLTLAFWALPVLVMFTVFINVYFVLYKGGSKELDWDSNQCAWVAAAAAGGVTVLSVVVGVPIVRRHVYREQSVRRAHQEAEAEAQVAASRARSKLSAHHRSSSNNSRPGGGGSAAAGGPWGAASTARGSQATGTSTGDGTGTGTGTSGGESGGRGYGGRGGGGSASGAAAGTRTLRPYGSQAAWPGAQVHGSGAQQQGYQDPDALPGAVQPGQQGSDPGAGQAGALGWDAAALHGQMGQGGGQGGPGGGQEQPAAWQDAGAEGGGGQGGGMAAAGTEAIQQQQQQLLQNWGGYLPAQQVPVWPGPGGQAEVWGQGGQQAQGAGQWGGAAVWVPVGQQQQQQAVSPWGHQVQVPALQQGWGQAPQVQAWPPQQRQLQQQQQHQAQHQAQQQQQQQLIWQSLQRGMPWAAATPNPGAMVAGGPWAQQQFGAPLGAAWNPAGPVGMGVGMPLALAGAVQPHAQLDAQQMQGRQQGYAGGVAAPAGAMGGQQQQQQRPEPIGEGVELQPLPRGGSPRALSPLPGPQYAPHGQRQARAAPHAQHAPHCGCGCGGDRCSGHCCDPSGESHRGRMPYAPRPSAARPSLHCSEIEEVVECTDGEDGRDWADAAKRNGEERDWAHPVTRGSRPAHVPRFSPFGPRPRSGPRAVCEAYEDAPPYGRGPSNEAPQEGGHGLHLGHSGVLGGSDHEHGDDEGDGQRRHKEEEGLDEGEDEDDGDEEDGEDRESGDGPDRLHANNVHWQNTFDQLKAIVLHGTNVNVHDDIELDEAVQRLHQHAEVFDPSTEDAFKYLQVVTAICDSFSHGANDVANSVGPFTAIWYIYNNQRVDYYSSLPVWILVLGGVGIVFGLATYGYNIIRAIGVRLSVITPSRGFCIELSTALVVVVAARYGLPVSTTHCQVGATAGMGLMEGSSGINWALALQFFLGWIVTLLITGIMSAAMFSAASFAPCIQQGRAIVNYENAILELSAKLDLILNRTNYAGIVDPNTWGTFSAELNATLASSLRYTRLALSDGNSRSTRPVQTIDHHELTEFLGRTVNTYVNNSLPYIGGMGATGQLLPKQP